MTRRHALACAVLLAGCASSRGATSSSTTPMTVPVVTPRALSIYHDAYVIDTHNDMPSKMLDDGYDPDVRHPAGFGAKEGNTDLPRLVESGITAQFMSAWVDSPYAKTPGASYARALQYVDVIHAFVKRHPERLTFATTAAEVRRAKQDGKVAVFIGLEGGHAIEGSLERLRDLYGRGVRYMTLTWNNGNTWAGSSIGVDGSRQGGLTDFGRTVIREMNRLGMLVDLSHVSDSTFFDAIAASSAPIIASHSSARALNDVPRNLSDDQLRAVAKNGGVVNVNFYSRFLDPEFRSRVDALDATIAAERRAARAAPGTDTATVMTRIDARRDSVFAAIPPTPFHVLIDHFDHIAKVAGVDHVGIGSDFDGVSALPSGMEDVTRLPRIAQALLNRGYSDANVAKMLGGNMMRVMSVVLKP